MFAWSSPVRTVLVGSLLVPVVLLTGCSGDDSGSGDKADAGPSASATGPVDPGDVAPADLPEVPAVRRAEAALDDVELTGCSTDAGEQQVTGTVTNSTGKSRDYAITVSWTDDDSVVLARGVAVVQDVEGGGTAEFELGADVPEAATICTFFVQRGRVV